MRILVAEDERITRTTLVRQLEGWGHQVTAAEDGEQAWEQYQSGAFEIVITDWEMPRLSGVELIQRIRAGGNTGEGDRHDGAAYVYIIMLTSRSNKSDIVGGIEAGADDFVSKPFDKEELRVRVLAGERVVRLERTLSRQNDELRAAGERMRHDLEAAARVQRAMLPRENITTSHVRSAWTYVPTDELAGDAIGLHLIDDRYLVSYVVDVSGHGVPAALLAVTAMHALSPAGEGSLLLKGADEGEGIGRVNNPSRVVAELNRRFCAGDNDGRFLTMILCVLDSHAGLLHFARAGHPLPVLVRSGKSLAVSEDGGLPLGLVDSMDYEEVVLQLEPGDRVALYSDGFIEQPGHSQAGQFGDARFAALLTGATQVLPERLVTDSVDSLTAWAGKRSFVDDVSLVVVDWLGR